VTWRTPCLGYKLTHFKQYPPGTQYVYSYFESRGGKWTDVVFFGLQYFMKRYLSGPVSAPAPQRTPCMTGTPAVGEWGGGLEDAGQR
jgi:hypothetical protein